MKHIHISYHKTKIGELIIGSFEEKICLLDFRYRKMRAIVDNRIKKGLQAEFVEQEDKVIKEAKKQVDEYLQGQRKEFNIPLLLVGSEFQKQVWKALLQVKYGQTASYADLAKSIKNPKAVRAVASANGANAIALIIPCHRIIKTGGGLGGYGGGLPVKKKLLKLERESVIFNN
ncbi:cysteine methyltransferase [Candidatus Campbellbacteria bacterium]|nr:MAG: cysteine methyltransferase [Candidatus Campbellbacteria bacterium]